MGRSRTCVSVAALHCLRIGELARTRHRGSGATPTSTASSTTSSSASIQHYVARPAVKVRLIPRQQTRCRLKPTVTRPRRKPRVAELLKPSRQGPHADRLGD